MRCARRKVHVLTPLNESTWISHDQLSGSWPRGQKAEVEQTGAAECLDAAQASAGVGGGNFSAWIEDASHWDSDASQRSGLSESSVGVAREPPIGAVGPVDAGKADLSSWRAADVAAEPGTPSSNPACTQASNWSGRRELSRAASGASSQSSMRSAHSSYRDGPSGWGSGGNCEGVHAAARRSLEESARSPRPCEPTAPIAVKKQKPGGLSRLFRSIPSH